GIYVFYQVQQDSQREQAYTTLSVIDEKGSLFTTEMPYHNQQTLLRPLYHFIQSAMKRQGLNGDVSPQQLAVQAVHFFEVMGNVKQQQGYLESRKTANDISQPTLVNIQVVAELNEESSISYTIYCDQQKFSSLVYGDALFT